MSAEIKTVKREEMAIARQRHGKHLYVATNAHARMEEMLGHW
jgi:hypothetical protein